MLKEVWCTTCKINPHIDHYICSNCKAWLGGIFGIEGTDHRNKNYNRKYLYCPYCGKKLYSNKEKSK